MKKVELEFMELLNIKIAIQEKCEKYGSTLISLEESENTDNNYYNLIKKEYHENKRLYDKILDVIKNFDGKN